MWWAGLRGVMGMVCVMGGLVPTVAGARGGCCEYGLMAISWLAVAIGFAAVGWWVGWSVLADRVMGRHGASLAGSQGGHVDRWWRWRRFDPDGGKGCTVAVRWDDGRVAVMRQVRGAKTSGVLDV